MTRLPALITRWAFGNKLVLLGFALLSGARWNAGENREEGLLKASNPPPLVQVLMIDHAQMVLGERRVPIDIPSYGTIYVTLGVTKERFAYWESQYGMDSLGVGTDGSLLIPGFPVFSKVAWTYIDHVDLSDAETRDLVSECERAVANTDDASASELFGQIHDLALEAIQESATLRFGQP